MDRIAKLRARRQAGLATMTELLELAARENRDLTAEEQTRFDALKAEDDAIGAQLAREEEVERRLAAAARPAPALPGASNLPIPAQPAEAAA